MLLAEANQWPADVRDYFGDGDECHMAFHFPLMPRMFMALRQEDRHAITEILNQTPEIPETCQWALFLRNHDELTLEMVTDEERDYMYRTYAADPQMRINVGIRRRLAPLVENSRRRVELMNTLLFSMPGTPIVYYGDEIGMGDNIYLGDRNGVRTPMQWSSDRNGGFSRADTARLFAPPVMDPVYGYQSINVEAQERYPFSLLNWMKRLIAMRRQHRVFGRGALEFVGCPNRKILAYLRRDEDETILVVANLSRHLQPAELDLSACAGLIPIEMAGLVEFPRIGDKPYFLTIGPYGSYWFSLQSAAMAINQTAPRPIEDPSQSPTESLPVLLMGVEWQKLLDAATRTVLEREALTPFLRRQRWFGGKSRDIRQARFTDWAMVRGGSTPSFVAIASVLYTDGWTETYLLPLALVAGDASRTFVSENPGAVLALITGARKGAIVDGFLDDETCARLLALVGQRAEVMTMRGGLRGIVGTAPESGVGPERPTVPIGLPATEGRWTRGTADQSNSVAFVNDQYVLKLFRRIEPGPNPELELTACLMARGFQQIPSLAGALLYERPGLESGTLAVVEAAIQHQGSGWEFTIDELRRYYERVGTRLRASTVPAGDEPPPFFAALENWYLAAAAMLGRRTAEMHLALGGSEGDAFAPQPLTPDALRTLADDVRAHAERTLDFLQSRLETLGEAARRQAETVLASRERLLETLETIRRLDRAGMRTRVHGDYHLGQVLRTDDDFVILDFEGEPARTLAERRAKQSPLKDVAGMLRSFSYAAHAALFAFAVHAPDEHDSLEPWADTWQHWVSSAFLKSYRARVGAAPLLPSSEEFDVLLRALTLDKALYELEYELNNRPEWVRIPLAGILKLASALQS
jgi:maltose alpha-D-glucosyltransferase/alpha-amylase